MYAENPRDSDMWVEAFEAKHEGKGKPFVKEDWDQLLGHCMVSMVHIRQLSDSIADDTYTGCDRHALHRVY